MAGATIVSPVAYVIPIWSTALVALLLSEPVGFNTVAGAVLVVAGMLTTRLLARGERAPRQGAAEPPDSVAPATVRAARGGGGDSSPYWDP